MAVAGSATASTDIGIVLRRALVARASFGHSEGTRAELESMGYDDWIEHQLEPAAIDDSELDARLASYSWLGMSAASLRQQYTGGGWSLSEDSKAVRVLRAVESKRQLFERVVDLWNDHFNVPFTAQDANFLRPPHEERVIRDGALGKFPSLLGAIVRSPAIGAYLDQDSNVEGQPNENFARELLELYTLGEGNGYSEHDVREVARCFTGWGYVRHWQPGTFGTFQFDASAHDDSEKTVLGRVIPAGGGEGDGDLVLRILSRDPRTARTVARKILGWFLGPAAASGTVHLNGTSLLDLVTQEYTATDGDIRDMVRLTLSRDFLIAAAPWRRRKLKQPFHYAASLLRAIGARIVSPTTAVYALGGLGQVPFEWPDPDGYPDESAAWSGTLAPRWRFAANLLNGWASWADVDPADLTDLCRGATSAQWGRCVAAALTAGEMQLEDTSAIQAFVNQSSSPGNADLIGAFELGASSPSFQTY